ncbi:haloacid dehalogenase-like hydrolase [Hyphomonas sp.]|uniref:haloacid dehalogenase-like hydrolase n=1 Tax=Hyphomonas sp. TaxID=87 RepID=UPI00391890EC
MNPLKGRDHAGVSDSAAADRLQADLRHTAPGVRIFVDFDHTLFLWNSTEAYLDEVRPSGVFAPVLKLISGLVPWRAFGRNGYFVWRDFVRLLFVMVFAPWTRGSFGKRAPDLFAAHLNARLDAMLQGIDPSRIVIVSFGLASVIRPLLAGSRYAQATLVAPGLFGQPGARARGKVEMLRKAGVEIDPSADIVITDSAKDDADLLAAAQKSHVVEWPEAVTRPAHADAYFPFFYTARIKRSPGFLVKQVFLEELPIILLMFAVLDIALAIPVLILITMLFIAYMLVYEIGYAENDRVGEQKEVRPKLSARYFESKTIRMQPDAWVWAAGVTLLGFSITPEVERAAIARYAGLPGLEGTAIEILALSGIWMAFLLLSRAVFWVFNHAPLAWRVFVYLPLHATKYFGPLIFLTAHPAGVALGLAQMVRTWAMYAIRRAGGDEHLLSSQMVRLCFLAVFSVVIFRVVELTLQEAILLVISFIFCLVRALPEIRRKMTGTQKKLALAPR